MNGLKLAALSLALVSIGACASDNRRDGSQSAGTVRDTVGTGTMTTPAPSTGTMTDTMLDTSRTGTRSDTMGRRGATGTSGATRNRTGTTSGAINSPS